MASSSGSITRHHRARFGQEQNNTSSHGTSVTLPTGQKYGWKSTFGPGYKFDAKSSFSMGCTFGFGCTFGSGCIFRSYCTINSGSTFGDNCAFGKGCKFGDNSTFGNGCTFKRKTSIGSNSKIGNGSIFSGDIRIGSHSNIGNKSVFSKYAAIGPYTHIGDGCRFGDHTCLQERATIGSNVEFKDRTNIPRALFLQQQIDKWGMSIVFKHRSDEPKDPIMLNYAYSYPAKQFNLCFDPPHGQINMWTSRPGHAISPFSESYGCIVTGRGKVCARYESYNSEDELILELRPSQLSASQFPSSRQELKMTFNLVTNEIHFQGADNETIELKNIGDVSVPDCGGLKELTITTAIDGSITISDARGRQAKFIRLGNSIEFNEVMYFGTGQHISTFKF